MGSCYFNIKDTDLFFLYKIVNNMLNTPELLWLIDFYVPSKMICQNVPYHCNNIGTNEESNSVIKPFPYFVHLSINIY